jgi:radical SAM protein with 4Fe4S-binding SPASM domain
MIFAHLVKNDCRLLMGPARSLVSGLITNGAVMRTLEELKRLHDQAEDQPAMSSDLAQAECLFIHRTAVVMADGEVVTCANMYAENVGHLDEKTTFSSLWNNERMQSVRRTLGTENEWAQCKQCWFREIRYAEQRRSWAALGGRAAQAALTKPAEYQPISWDFRKAQAERKID